MPHVKLIWFLRLAFCQSWEKSKVQESYLLWLGRPCPRRRVRSGCWRHGRCRHQNRSAACCTDSELRLKSQLCWAIGCSACTSWRGPDSKRGMGMSSEWCCSAIHISFTIDHLRYSISCDRCSATISNHRRALSWSVASISIQLFGCVYCRAVRWSLTLVFRSLMD